MHTGPSLTRFMSGLIAATAVGLGSLAAQEVNSAALSENGWFSDDTRADGTGLQSVGTNLIGDTLTDDPEATASGTAAHDTGILGQIIFGDAIGTEPVGTHGGAVHLRIGPSASGKSQISHRKDDLTGHGPGSGFGPGFMAEYSWMGDGTASVTASLKFGIKTSEFGITPVSTRTGENVWDKVLIYEPGNLNGEVSDALWHTETTTHTSGTWWFFDRTAGAGTIGTPMTLSAMAGSGVIVAGPKTVADVYALITAPGAIITSVQFGIGSGNAGGSVYVNQLETSVYRVGMTTTFGTPSPFDQDVTPDVIFGAGNVNGSYTVDRVDGIELGLRGKLRFPPSNIFKSNGDGTYTFNTGSGTGTFPNAEWAFEWSVNTDYDSTSGLLLDDLTYEIGMDFDPGAGTDYLAFDHITPGVVIPFAPAPPPTVFWDHSTGTNATGNGMGVEATDGPTYVALLAANNVAQNSWRTTFFDEAPFTFDPGVPGFYDFYVAAFDGGTEVARTAITVIAVSGTTMTLEADTCQTDQDPVEAGVQIEVELWQRNPADVEITGFQAFLAFDDVAMTYEGLLSSYPAAPYETHIQPIATAEVAPGELRLDGLTFSMPGPMGDALLATLVFTVPECDAHDVDFDLTQPFDSEFSIAGSPIVTALLDSPDVVADDTPPVIATNPDITQAADAGVGGGCTSAVVTFSPPGATDNCDPSPDVVCDPPSGSVFPVGITTVTCTATDECGNTAMSTFDVEVTATNVVTVTVELAGVAGPVMRCIRFMSNGCTFSDVTLTFTGFPATFSGDVEVPCGTLTSLCAKDEQHTKWDDTTLTLAGTQYVADSTLVLDGGDTDNDGDVDINDVTLFLSQFGDPASPGGCPWDGLTRDADFSNNTVIGSEDYVFLTANWLTTSSCMCAVVVGGYDERARLAAIAAVTDAASDRADLNRDGWVDVLDVEVFEARHGLSGLSQVMRATGR